MKTNKLLVFSTIALLIINLVLVYFLWNDKKRHSKKGKDRGDMMVNELNLDDKQKQEHKQIKEAHFNNLKPIFDSIASARKRFYTFIKDSTSNDSLVNQYTSYIGELHAQMSGHTFDHFKKLRAILNPDQQVKLDTMVQRMVQDMGKRGGKSGRK